MDASVTIPKVDNSTIEQTSSGLRVKASGITATELAANSVNTTELVNGSVTTAKIAAGAVTRNETTGVEARQWAAKGFRTSAGTILTQTLIDTPGSAGVIHIVTGYVDVTVGNGVFQVSIDAGGTTTYHEVTVTAGTTGKFPFSLVGIGNTIASHTLNVSVTVTGTPTFTIYANLVAIGL
jgi:hypothetical protein